MSCRSRLVALLAILTTLAMTVTACGVPTDLAPEQIAAEDLPPDLQRDGVVPTEVAVDPTPLPVNFPTNTATVYFIGEDNRLVAVERAVDAAITKSLVLRFLLDGPTVDEREFEGFSTALDADLSVLSSDELGATVIVDVESGSTTEALTGNEAKLAWAQIVYTLTEIPKFASFRLLIDGEPQSLPTDQGVANPAEPVSRTDYQICCAPMAEDPDESVPVDVNARSTPTPIPTAVDVTETEIVVSTPTPVNDDEGGG